MNKDLFKIAIISFCILFTELLLIRLIGTEIRIFAYIPNLILLATFVGSGVGMLMNKKLPLFLSLISVVAISLILTTGYFKSITEVFAAISDSFIWFTIQTTKSLITGILMTMFIFLLTLFAFIPMGQYLGQLLEKSKRINVDYSVNIIFSLLGIVSFSYLSSLFVNPYFALILPIILLGYLCFEYNKPATILSIFLFLPIVIGELIGSGNKTHWSAYQKLQIVDLPANPMLPEGKMLNVNDVGYMGLLDLSKEAEEKQISEKMKSYNVNLEPENYNFLNQYDIPFLINPNRENALIIGAGGGNDVAGAVRAGIQEVTAVEIDKKIVELGKELHPEDPYNQENVLINIDDGRSFLRKTDKKFDFVIMGLTDSHTLNSNLTNVQLDNFLYTTESMQEVNEVLKDDGILFLSFDVRKPWIGDRIKNSISNAFGHEPFIFSMQNVPPFYGWGGVFFVASKNPETLDKYLEQNTDLSNYLKTLEVNFGEAEKTLTDNWPYLYLESPRIPRIHFIVSTVIILTFLGFALKLNIFSNFNRTSFLLGTGFLLYEFQNIGKTSLLYGNTWVTNVYIISAILGLILIANYLDTKIKINLKTLYILLILAFGLQLITPLAYLNNTSGVIKYLFVPLYLNLPLLFSGLIFIKLFSKAKDKKFFFGSNLLGSAFGGLLAFLSYIFGIKSLLVVSLIIYISSYFVKN